VITATTSRIDRLELLVRSLRSVGCLARIIVLVPRGLILSSNLSLCGVEAVEIGSISSRALRSPHKIRWEWYFRFFANRIDEFDRVFHTDAFDAFFQADPFTVSISSNVLYLLSESRYIGLCPVNSQWVLKCVGQTGLELVKGNSVLCSGSVLGSAVLFQRLAAAMVNHSGWDDCWQKAHDQGVFNYLVYADLSSKIPIKILGCESGYLTMGYCSSFQIRFFDSKKRVVTPLLRKPSIYIHQYNRYSEVDREFQRKCGLQINRTAEKSSQAFLEPDSKLPS
jgi:hypothetical protein